jgi:osmotically-inducible protein OsmY
MVGHAKPLRGESEPHFPLRPSREPGRFPRLARTSLLQSLAKRKELVVPQPSGKSDWEVQQDVERALSWDGRLSPTAIGIQVDHGIVTLTGTVDCWSAVRAAEDAVHEASGVLDVANDLEIRTASDGGRTDTEIARAVRQALEWDGGLPASRLHSTVSHGVVTLEGTVSSPAQRLHAERAVEHLMGIVRVINRIEV